MSSESTTAAKDSKRIVAAIVAIVLPGLGIHKFILGMTTPGLIYLLTFLFCGALGGVTILMSIIEGIVYSTKSDEEFVPCIKGKARNNGFERLSGRFPGNRRANPLSYPINSPSPDNIDMATSSILSRRSNP
jgi:TM2 domain-containing membrane protein YozV